jgi:hypothetical protein
VHGGEAVHGLGPWQESLSFVAAKPPSKDDKPALQSSASCPTVTLAWHVADHGPLSTEMEILVVRFACCCFVDHL